MNTEPIKANNWLRSHSFR